MGRFLETAIFSEISEQIGYDKTKVIISLFSPLISFTVEPTAVDPALTSNNSSTLIGDI